MHIIVYTIPKPFYYKGGTRKHIFGLGQYFANFGEIIFNADLDASHYLINIAIISLLE